MVVTFSAVQVEYAPLKYANWRMCFQLWNGRKIKFEKKGSEAFGKVEKKAPPSQPGLEPGSSAYATDALPL